MNIVALDNEILNYLPLLGNDEKKSIIAIIKSFINLKKDNAMNIEEYNREIDNAIKQYNEGNYISHDSFVKEMKTW